MRICGLCNHAPALKGQSRCRSCKKKPYMQHRKESCEECGFVPVHKVQLDVDHVDGDRSNNHPSNLKTLCANCHRLKTWLAKDYAANDEAYVEESCGTLDLFPS